MGRIANDRNMRTRSNEAERVRGINDRGEKTENTVDTEIGGIPSEENSVLEAVWKELKENQERIKSLCDKIDKQNEKLEQQGAMIESMRNEMNERNEGEKKWRKGEERRERERENMIDELKDVVESKMNTWAETVKDNKYTDHRMKDGKGDSFINEVRKELVMDVVPILKREMDRAKSVVITGIKEPIIDNYQEREREEMRHISELMKLLEMDSASNEITCNHRLGIYMKDSSRPRPIKLTFVREETQLTILRRAHKLKTIKGCSGVYIRRDIAKEERMRINSIVSEVKVLNEKRSKEEIGKFFWVRNGLRGPKKVEVGGEEVNGRVVGGGKIANPKDGMGQARQ